MSDPNQPMEVPQPPTPRWGTLPFAFWHRSDPMTRATVVNSVLTLFAVFFALIFGAGSLIVAVNSLRATSESLRQSNLSTTYTLGFEIDRFQEDHPKLAKFFDKAIRGPLSDQALADEYQKLSAEDQVLIYVGCEKIADFSEIAFMQRDLFPPDDWDTWWRYMVDTYDESAVYRDFLAKRKDWYAFVDELQPENVRGTIEVIRGNRKPAPPPSNESLNAGGESVFWNMLSGERRFDLPE
jgi:hypothetical protein